MKRYPVGPKTLARAAKTEAGKLAELLNRVLYSADNREVREQGFSSDKFDQAKMRWVAEREIYINASALPSRLSESKPQYIETQRLMLAIRDFLEEVAIREVCE